MNPSSVIIIDDFYDDPDAVRKSALLMDYPKPSNNCMFSRYSDKPYNPSWITEKVSSVVGEKLLDNDCNGYFNVSLTGLTEPVKTMTWDMREPHKSPYWAGVVFLTPESYYMSGFKTWRHFETDVEINSYGSTPIDDFQDNWIETMDVKMKYNRLVLFRPFMYYSYGDTTFGDNILTGKMIQTFSWQKYYG